jgi:hypothetical protein
MAFTIGLGFLIFFLGVPWLLTKMAADLLGMRRLPWIPFKIGLYVIITVAFWEVWQVPRVPVQLPHQAAPQQQAR